MKINNFRSELSDISAKMAKLPPTSNSEWYLASDCKQWMVFIVGVSANVVNMKSRWGETLFELKNAKRMLKDVYRWCMVGRLHLCCRFSRNIA